LAKTQEETVVGTNLQRFDNQLLAIISNSDYQSFIGLFELSGGFLGFN